jgi:hypothetical protein
LNKSAHNRVVVVNSETAMRSIDNNDDKDVKKLVRFLNAFKEDIQKDLKKTRFSAAINRRVDRLLTKIDNLSLKISDQNYTSKSVKELRIDSYKIGDVLFTLILKTAPVIIPQSKDLCEYIERNRPPLKDIILILRNSRSLGKVITGFRTVLRRSFDKLKGSSKVITGFRTVLRRSFNRFTSFYEVLNPGNKNQSIYSYKKRKITKRQSIIGKMTSLLTSGIKSFFAMHFAY